MYVIFLYNVLGLSLRNSKAALAQKRADLANVHVAQAAAVSLGYGRRHACRLPKLGAIGHDTVRGLRLVGRGDATSRDEQILHILRDQATVGDLVPIAVREEVMTGSRSRGVVNVDIVVRRGDGVLKARKRLEILHRQRVLAKDLAALANADLQGRGLHAALRKARNVLAQETPDLKDLLPCLDLGLRDGKGIGGVQLNHARGIEVQNALIEIAEDQHVLARILDESLLLKLLVEGIDHGAVLREKVLVHVAHAEAERHGLAKAVAFASHAAFAARKHGKLGVTRGVDKGVGRKGQTLGFSQRLDARDAVPLAMHLDDGGVKEKLDAAFETHAIEQELEDLLVKVGGGAFGIERLKALHDLEEKAAREVLLLPGPGHHAPIAHKGHDEAVGRCAPKAVVFFDQEDVRAAARRLDRGAGAGKAAAHNDQVIVLLHPIRSPFGKVP